MRRIFVIEGIRGVKVNCPNSIYQEVIKVGRYKVKALLFPKGGYSFYVFQGDVLKAIISNEEWYISKVDGECQNLLNRLLKIYG